MNKDISLNGSRHRWFTFKKLRVILRLQRKLDKGHLKRILAKYHVDLVDIPLVCIMPGGDLHVANGQHTIEAYKIENPSEVGMYCRVTMLDPDIAFNLKNSGNKNVTLNQQFWTSHGFGRAFATTIETTCLRYGIHLQKFGRPRANHVVSVARLLELYTDNPAKFDKRMAVLGKCFMSSHTHGMIDAKALSSAFLTGFTDFLTRRNPPSLTKIKKVLKDHPMVASKICQEATVYASSSSNRKQYISQVLVDLCR